MKPIEPGEAAAITRAIMASWPQPELDTEGVAALMATIVDSRWPLEAWEMAVTALRLQAPQFRPMAEMVQVARRNAERLRRESADFQRQLPAGPDLPLAYRLANAAIFVDGAMKGRAAGEKRFRVPIGVAESGSMRHVSTILGIGPTMFTAASPLAEQLCEELLRRADDAETRS